MPTKVTAALLLCALMACTGGDEAPFSERAETVCRQIQRRLAAIPAPTTAAEVDVWLTRAVEENRRGTEQLRGLLPDADDASTAEALVTASEDATKALEDWAHAHRAKDDMTARRALRRVEKARERYAGTARSLSLDACAEPIATPTPG